MFQQFTLMRLDAVHAILSQIREAVMRLAELITRLAGRPPRKAWYSPKEFGALDGKSAWHVRAWCRDGEINAELRGGRPGGREEWKISHAEYVRYNAEGLLPKDPKRNRRPKR